MTQKERIAKLLADNERQGELIVKLVKRVIELSKLIEKQKIKRTK